jgi:bacillithiol biosynthesis cysteine-adding enzyme BshC
LDTRLKFQNLYFFSKLVKAYLNHNESSLSLYSLFPTIENFSKAIEYKSKHPINREVLVQVLKKQYAHISDAVFSIQNIEKLKEQNTFTITTGHQLNLFTGPLYFIYKIVSTIKLTHQLQIQYPQYNFVPVYWMATEDHDWAEINHFHTSDKDQFYWENEVNYAVGTVPTKGLENVANELKSIWESDVFGSELHSMFEKAYLNGLSLSEATRTLVHQLFGSYGLVILDAQDSALKKSFIPIMKKELKHQSVFNEVTQTNHFLKENGFEIQVNPREINLFYLTQNSRQRILKEADSYRVNHTDLVFASHEIEAELESHPERFSPNVLMRPLYQESILPNLAYIGGGGEIAYWLQLKGIFDAFQIPFPMLVVRNSALWITDKQIRRLEKLGLTSSDMMLTAQEISNLVIHLNEPSNKPDFQEFENQIKILLHPIENWAFQIDPTLISGMKGILQKQLNEWEHWEQKLQKSLKKKNSDALERAEKIRAELFPNETLQERYLNFSVFYKDMGNEFIRQLWNEFDPLVFEFKILKLPTSTTY